VTISLHSFDPDKNGKARIAATDMAFPNGPCILPDGKTYLVAETMGHRITAFDVTGDGSLVNRRVWAETGPKVFPDGICWDERLQGLWVGNGGGRNVGYSDDSKDSKLISAVLFSYRSPFLKKEARSSRSSKPRCLGSPARFIRTCCI